MRSGSEIIKQLLDLAPTPKGEIVAGACGALAVFGAAAFGVEASEGHLLILPVDLAIATGSGAAFINHWKQAGRLPNNHPQQ